MQQLESIENSLELSVVATVYNGEKILEQFISELDQHLKNLSVSYEIILVDDASIDKSRIVIEELAKNNNKIKALFLSKNHGQQLAMSAGIHETKGLFTVIMDGDMQNPPSAITELYKRAKEGMDVVYCVSKKRNGVWDELSSKFLWFILCKILRIKLVPNQLMMRIMNKNVVDIFKKYKEKIRTVGGITHDIGMTYDVIEVENRRRVEGRSNYSFWSRLELSIDFMLEITNNPLNFLIYLGLIIFLGTFLLSSYYLYMYFMSGLLPGFTSIILSIFFFGSLNIIIFGITARYLANIYSEVRQRPLFVIEKKINLNE